VSSDSQSGNDYLPDGGLHRIVAADDPGPCSRRLSREQRQALLDVRQKIASQDQPREFLQRLVGLIGQIVQAKVGVAGKRGGSWIVAAESASEPAIAGHVNGGPHPFDRMSATPGLRVELWRTPEREWTLVGLSSHPNPPVILIIDGDWTACALVFRDPNEADRIWAIFDWSEEGWQSFLADPDVPPIMKEAGHQSRPVAFEFAGRVDA